EAARGVDYGSEAGRAPVYAAKSRRFPMQRPAVVGQLSEEALPGFVGNSHVPVAVVARDPQLPISNSGQSDLVGRLYDEGIHEAAFAIDADSIGAQEAPRLAAQHPPFADPILSPILSEAVGFLS